MTIKKCKESQVIQTHLVIPSNTNSYGTLFGGKLMYWLDDTAAISVCRHTRQQSVTASMDQLSFLMPIKEGHSICIHSFVSGVGHRSVEVFIKIIGEELLTGERYLAGTAFMTFVIDPKPFEEGYEIPKVEPESAEEIYICKNYNERKQARLTAVNKNKTYIENISLSLPWDD